MLAGARRALSAERAEVKERVRLVRADLRSVRLRRRFPLVIAPFNVFMHLYDRRDVERALATVRAHLAPGGRFVFDVLVPDSRELARSPARTYREGFVRVPAGGTRFRYGEAFDYDPVSQVQLVTMVFEEDEASASSPGQDASFIVPLAHRQFFPAELEALLHYNGLTIVERYGDFSRGPLTRVSESQILVARVRRR